MVDKIILYNAIKTPDGTILESKNRHDFVSHVDKNGETYINDGGKDYFHRSINIIPYEDLSVYDDDSHENRAKYLEWGSNYDKDMNRLPKTVFKPIKDLDTDHIQAILEGNWCKSELYKRTFNEELKRRTNG